MRFDLPSSWRHGRGLAAKTGNILRELGCTHSLLLTDSSLVRIGVIRPVILSLEESGIAYKICDAVTPEPTVMDIKKIEGELDLESFDSVVAVGGGSVIDVAKSLAILAQFGGDIRNYAGFDRVPAPLTRKIIAVPTTAGTGSEISEGSALIDGELQSKFLVLSNHICPSVAITDPEMTLSMPPEVTANSGVDALTHAMESYVSKDASFATEPFSIRAVGLIGSGLKPAYLNGDDIGAREKVQIGATMAMVAGMNAHMGLCHAMVMPICALYHIPHGRACGMVLPQVLEFNADVAGEKVLDIFKTMGMLEANAGVETLNSSLYSQLADFLGKIGVGGRLKDYGYNDSHMQTIIQETVNSVQCRFNPRKPEATDIEAIVRRLI